MCSRAKNCVFLDDKKVYCQRHRDLIKGEVRLLFRALPHLSGGGTMKSTVSVVLASEGRSAALVKSWRCSRPEVARHMSLQNPRDQTGWSEAALGVSGSSSSRVIVWILVPGGS